MYPLLPLGPLRLATGGLLLMLALLLGHAMFTRLARRRGGAALADGADRAFFAALGGAALGGRLWHALLNLGYYSRAPEQLWALRLADWGWPGALLGGALAGWLFCRWRGLPALALADLAALALPLPQAVASFGLLLSGEAFGAPSSLPWAVELFGARRHPTQLYYALAALLSFAALRWIDRREPPPGALSACALGLQGLTLLLVEALRADSLLLPGGIRAAQVAGLALVLAALFWLRLLTAGSPASNAAAVEASAPSEEGAKEPLSYCLEPRRIRDTALASGKAAVVGRDTSTCSTIAQWKRSSRVRSRRLPRGSARQQSRRGANPGCASCQLSSLA